MSAHRCPEWDTPCRRCESLAEAHADDRALGEYDDRELDGNHTRDYSANLTRGGW